MVRKSACLAVAGTLRTPYSRRFPSEVNSDRTVRASGSRVNLCKIHMLSSKKNQ